MTAAESTSILTRKVFDPITADFAPGERSMVSWLTCDNVDHEKDVVVSSGVDYKTYFLGKTPEEGNPVVLAVHDFGKWPLGRCEWIKAKRNKNWNGLCAKTVFDEDVESEMVFRKIKSKSLRGISIGFRPPDDLQPGEWGPPTREELARRPDWKGAERIIRRCVLLEYSVCSLPMNAQALVIAVNKGVHRPVYSIPTPKASTTMTEDTPPVEAETETKAAKPAMCDCGEKDCDKCGGMAEGSAAAGGDTVKPKDMDDEDDDMETMAVENEDEGETEDEPTEDESEEPEEEEDDPEDDSDDEPEESGAFKRYDHVSVKAPHYRGVGRLESIHTKGHVPHASNHMMGTPDDPAACIKAYRKMGDGHVSTDDHIAVKLAHLTKLGSPLTPPSKGKPTPKAAKATVRTEPVVEPLPPLVIQSDQEVRAEAIAKLNALLHPDNLRKMVREEAERAAGYV